jgi:zinc protease
VFAAVDRAALLGYYRERYVPNNIVVVIAGDVTAADARAVVARHFGSAARSRLGPVLVPDEPAQLAPRELHRHEKVEVGRCVLAWPIPGLADPSAPVLDLLASVLGGGESSVLWQGIREKLRLVHTIDASSWNPGTSGLFCVTYTCDAGRRAEAEREILDLIASLAKARGFAPRQVRKAYRQAVVGEINTCKTMSGQASRLGVAEVVVGDLGFSASYFERLARVGPADLARAVRQHLAPGRLISVSLEPEAPPAQAAARGRAAPAGRADFEELRFANGARLVFQVDRRLPNLHLRLLTNGGPVCERAARRGSSALLATLLSKDTRRRSAVQVATRVEEAGGAFAAFSGENTLGLWAEVLPGDAELALGLIAEGALEPAFRARTLETEQEVQLAALREENDDVVSFARRLLRRKFFGAHPLAVSALGDAEGVRSTGPADLAELWGRLLVGPGAVLAVAGDFDPKRLVPRLGEFLARIPRGEPAGAGPAFTGPAEPGDFVERQPREQAIVLQGFPGPVIDAPDFYAAEVADELFSGMASRLFERVREQRSLAYFVRSGRVTGRSAAMFYFIAGTQPGKEDEVVAEIVAEIARVAAGEVSADEIRRCQARLKAGQRKALQTNSSRAMQAAIDVLQGRPLDHWRRYDSLIDAITPGELAAFAASRLKADARTQLVVRP